MDSSIKNENIFNEKNKEENKEEINSEKNSENNKRIETEDEINFFTEKNNRYDKIKDNNSEMIDNIRDMITMSKQINKGINKLNKKISKENNKIKKDNNHKSPFILKYEDYKSTIRNYYTNLNLSNKTNKTNKTTSKSLNLNKTNNLRIKNKLNKEFISVEKMFKKYNSKEWDEIYKKRFKSYQDNINKKKEDLRKSKEIEKKKKEDEIINYSNKKKSKSYCKRILNNYKPLYIKENKNEKKTMTNYFKNILERRYQLNKKEENDKRIYNNRYNDYIDKDSHNIINIKGKLYNLEEERNNLIAMTKRKNLFRSGSFKNMDFLKNEKQDLMCNKSFRKNIISETDKLIYEFFMRYLEEKNIYLN